MLRLLFIYPAVGKMQDPITAGVRNNILSIYAILSKRGYQIKLLAPEGSISTNPNLEIIQIPGKLQDHLPDNKTANFYPVYKNTFLQNALYYARQHQNVFDIIINFSNDWLPYYVTPFFTTPLIHRMNLGNEHPVVSDVIRQIAQQYPNRVGILTPTQAADVGIEAHSFLLGQGLDIDSFPFHSDAGKRKHLAFIARISPEKGLEDAAEIAVLSNHQLLVFGHIQDEVYFNQILKRYQQNIIYKGHLPLTELTKALDTCKALIFTPKWEEAFGGVIIQAMACGIPVISYARGGPKDIIQHHKTGFLISPDDIGAGVAAITQLDKISPTACRAFVKNNYSLKKLGDTYEAWFKTIL